MTHHMTNMKSLAVQDDGDSYFATGFPTCRHTLYVLSPQGIGLSYTARNYL